MACPQMNYGLMIEKTLKWSEETRARVESVSMDFADQHTIDLRMDVNGELRRQSFGDFPKSS
jgi:hypothetical protein